MDFSVPNFTAAILFPHSNFELEAIASSEQLDEFGLGSENKDDKRESDD